MKSAITSFILSAVLATGAHAQYAVPMDMSAAINQQAINQQILNRNASSLAMQYYNYMHDLRGQGYTGPSLPTGVTPQSLQQSIGGANDATQRFIRSGQMSSERRSFMANDFDMRAIRGCYRGVNYWGQWGYVCP